MSDTKICVKCGCKTKDFYLVDPGGPATCWQCKQEDKKKEGKRSA